MRYYVTACSPEDKQSLLLSLAGLVVDSEPGSLRNILMAGINPEDLQHDPRVSSIHLHPDDWPGLEIKLFAE